MKYFFLLFCFTYCAAQAQTDSILYFDGYDRITQPNRAAYYRKTEAQDSGKIFLGTEYWMDGHIKMIGHALDESFLYKIGKFSYYYKNGNKSGEGQYYSDFEQRVFGFKNKKWETWYANGKPREEWIYKIADDFSYDESLLMSYWDSTGRQLTVKGIGKYAFTDLVTTKDSLQKITFEGFIKQGRYDSVWRGYYANGRLYSEEIYTAGKLVRGKSFDGAGNVYTYDTIEAVSQFPGGLAELDKFVKLNLQPPMQVNSDILSNVVVRIFVGRTGFVGNVSVLRGVNPEMSGEAVRVAKLLPRFLPATNRGQPIDSYYTAAIHFSGQ